MDVMTGATWKLVGTCPCPTGSNDDTGESPQERMYATSRTLTYVSVYAAVRGVAFHWLLLGEVLPVQRSNR